MREIRLYFIAQNDTCRADDAYSFNKTYRYFMGDTIQAKRDLSNAIFTWLLPALMVLVSRLNAASSSSS